MMHGQKNVKFILQIYCCTRMYPHRVERKHLEEAYLV